MALMPPDPASTEPRAGETIEELFAALESPLLNYALRLAGTLALGEDVVQEAFMRLHAQFAEVREPRRWLYRTVHNLALNQRRQAAKTVSLDVPLEDQAPHAAEAQDTLPLPDEQIARWEGIGLVRLCLENLEPRSREVVRLKFHENLSYKEISARTGLTTGNVGYLLHHAIKAIAVELAKNGVIQ
ncbi:MAG TPA: RNA polymerase sigma factor [Verrucomicrobiae bacterium]|nr:RNA polymerase sigma factor [Verrucomicrobiae bacterium]